MFHLRAGRCYCYSKANSSDICGRPFDQAEATAKMSARQRTASDRWRKIAQRAQMMAGESGVRNTLNVAIKSNVRATSTSFIPLFILVTFAFLQLVSGASQAGSAAADRANQRRQQQLVPSGQQFEARPASTSQRAVSNQDEEISDDQGQSKSSTAASGSQLASAALAHDVTDEANADEPSSESTSEESVSSEGVESGDESGSNNQTSDEADQASSATSDDEHSPAAFEPIHVRPSRHSSARRPDEDSPPPELRRYETATSAPPSARRAATSQVPIQHQPTIARSRIDQVSTASFDLNMGADRMLISRPVPLADQIAAAGAATETTTGSRRQDLLYPSGVPLELGTASVGADPTTSAMGASHAHSSSLAHELANSVNICYTPVALVLVVLITMTVTLTCCLCAYLVMRHLQRHRFDLIASSKHFESSLPSGYAIHGGVGGAPTGRPSARALHQLQARRQQQQLTPTAARSCALHPLHRERECNKCSLGPDELETPVASFSNPYFLAGDSNAESAVRGGQLGAASLLLTAAPSASHEQDSDLHYAIESHIANLHSRQVTSSVQELDASIESRQNVANRIVPLSVVDLTNDAQRARIISNPRQGDLVAVDLEAHDIIGLGFEICGNQRDGVFVRSVNAHGPARASGCLEPGDKLKRLNVSFEQITLEDAHSILTCGSPYKLRLLVEKCAVEPGQLDQLARGQQRALPPHQQLRSFACRDSRLASTSILPPGHRHGRAVHAHGPLASAKSYLKRMTDKLLGQSESEQAFSNDALRSLGSEAPIGSAAARRQLQAEHGYLCQPDQTGSPSSPATSSSHFNDQCSFRQRGNNNDAFATSDNDMDADERTGRSPVIKGQSQTDSTKKQPRPRSEPRHIGNTENN